MVHWPGYRVDLAAMTPAEAIGSSDEKSPDLLRQETRRSNDDGADRVMKALNRHVERVFNPDRKETHWGQRKLKQTGCDLVYILGPKKNDSLELIVQIKQRS
jgi:hypothetical protein